MKWTEIRNQYPDKFVLVEAVSAYSKENKRIIEEMSLIEEYTSSKEAWSGYKKIHLEFPERELYIFHTSKEQIEVEEQRFIGVRGRI
ncbi:hypothetical protein [Bacillus taeanensis]|uniref:Uncharacterized protein n=1 Tax=Bacillus taeanensis TaxID=273032 RepID=A0A366XSQ8_9BACI|nr:hypothetical protein [Bacillus taeanensis]RBW68588.1 hypothetical protein DS031_15620 [Bacillus taeanensis]